MMIKEENIITWENKLDIIKQEEWFRDLLYQVDQEYENHTIYPEKKDIFRAFEETPFDKVKVVILGQDPYHGEGQAMGLSFSVPEGIKLPPSLRNIYKELEDDLKVEKALSGDLTRWAKQGVLLLNTTLTVRSGEAASHKHLPWERFTDFVIQVLNQKEAPIVYILWGNHARAKKKLIDKKHYILEASHPSPLSAFRGFFGSKPFSKTNEILENTGQEKINW